MKLIRIKLRENPSCSQVFLNSPELPLNKKTLSLPRVLSYGASGNRTHKEYHLRRILSPLRLPSSAIAPKRS
jgi:hypothetical protein